LITSFFIVKPLLITVIVGGLLAYIFYPLQKKLEKKVNSSFAAGIICLIVLLIIVLPSVYFVKVLIQESYVLFVLVKQKLATGIFTNCQNSLCQSIQSLTQNPEFSSQVQDVVKTVTHWIVAQGSQFLVSIPQFLLKSIIMFFSLFYFLKDGKEFLIKVKRYLSIHKKEYLPLLHRLKEITHGITFGYIIVALIQGITGAVGFFIFGISSPIFWGLLMAFLALIPIVGATLVWVPAALLLLINGILQSSTSFIVKGILLFVYGILFIGSVETLLKPKLMGTKAKIHPILIFLGIMGGLYLFGIIGVILGPLLLGFTAVVVENYFGKK
jgi:predicted PurR-regulated permease PerM